MSSIKLLGQKVLGSFFTKSQYLGLTDIPKLLIVRFWSLEILNINGDSPLAKTFHL
jgi:hypothetical protein